MKRRCCMGACGALTIMVAMFTGCKHHRDPSTESQENPLKPNLSGGAAQGAVQRGVQRQVNQNIMKNLGTCFTFFRTERNRPPRNLEEFKTYVKSDPDYRREAEALENGWVVMVFPGNPTSSTVVGYEKEVFKLHNNRLVVFGDGHVEMMVDPEFQEALKRQ